MFVDFRRLVSSAASFFFLAALYKFICSAISVGLFRCFDPKSCARVSDPVARLLLLFPPSHRRKAWHVSTAFFIRRKKERKQALHHLCSLELHRASRGQTTLFVFHQGRARSVLSALPFFLS